MAKINLLLLSGLVASVLNDSSKFTPLYSLHVELVSPYMSPFFYAFLCCLPTLASFWIATHGLWIFCENRVLLVVVFISYHFCNIFCRWKINKTLIMSSSKTFVFNHLCATGPIWADLVSTFSATVSYKILCSLLNDGHVKYVYNYRHFSSFPGENVVQMCLQNKTH